MIAVQPRNDTITSPSIDHRTPVLYIPKTDFKNNLWCILNPKMQNVCVPCSDLGRTFFCTTIKSFLVLSPEVCTTLSAPSQAPSLAPSLTLNQKKDAPSNILNNSRQSLPLSQNVYITTLNGPTVHTSKYVHTHPISYLQVHPKANFLISGIPRVLNTQSEKFKIIYH